MLLSLLIVGCSILGDRPVHTNSMFASYKLMPPLFHFDNYDSCMDALPTETTSPSYCLVLTEVVPNETSPLWHQISRFSTDRRHHYRHDRQYFGVCRRRCEELLQSLEISVNISYNNEQLYDDDLVTFLDDVHVRGSNDRNRFGQLIHKCLNYEFQEKYNLNLRTHLLYCESAEQPLEYDHWDDIFVHLCLVIALLNTASTMYDRRLRRKQTDEAMRENFYKIDLQRKRDRLLTSFSVVRNYHRIMQPLNSPEAKDLGFLHSYRTVGVFMVTLVHVILSAMAMPIQNTIFFEKTYHEMTSKFIQNDTNFIEVYFIMSAFLLTVAIKRNKLVTTKMTLMQTLGVYLKLSARRYLRLAPSLALFILFSVTITPRLLEGPFWRQTYEPERVFCRNFGWKNLLFINNFDYEKSCAHYTWYTAAEMQLFLVFTLYLVLSIKYPRLKKFLTGFILASAFVIPALITYFQKLDAITHIAPEDYRYFHFRGNENFYETYIPFYTHLGSYLFAILVADVYLKCSDNNTLNNYKGLFKFELGVSMLFVIAFIVVCSGTWVSTIDWVKPSIWAAIYAGVYRNVCVLLCCLILLGMCFKLGGGLLDICNKPLFRPLGRISFQAFVWHGAVLRVLLGVFQIPLHVNSIILIHWVLSAYVSTYILAFFFAIVFELPIEILIKSAVESPQRKNVKAE